jgi:hypothetical protein
MAAAAMTSLRKIGLRYGAVLGLTPTSTVTQPTLPGGGVSVSCTGPLTVGSRDSPPVSASRLMVSELFTAGVPMSVRMPPCRGSRSCPSALRAARPPLAAAAGSRTRTSEVDVHREFPDHALDQRKRCAEALVVARPLGQIRKHTRQVPVRVPQPASLGVEPVGSTRLVPGRCAGSRAGRRRINSRV